MASYFANSEFNQAQIVVRGIPLDRTSSFIPGTRFGPEVGRLGTANIESFSPYQRKDITQIRICDAGDLFFTFEPLDAPAKLIMSATRETYEHHKKQLAVGGEHTITPYILGEIVKFFPDLFVIQFDAHSDLREEFLGERFCHATAMSRTLDFIPREKLFQVGIRSFAQPAEMSIANLFPFNVLSPIPKIRDQIADKPVYITLDLDVLDPGAMPDVQTPQPGGCSYRELAQALAQLTGLKVIGGDIVEFCPKNSTAINSAALVAELVRELILLIAQP